MKQLHCLHDEHIVCSDARVGGMLAGKPGLLHCHMGAGGPPRSGRSATGGNGVSAAPQGASATGGGDAAAERDPLAPLFDAVQHSDVPVRLECFLRPLPCLLLHACAESLPPPPAIEDT